LIPQSCWKEGGRIRLNRTGALLGLKDEHRVRPEGCATPTRRSVELCWRRGP
jgi:hypothetical protein